MSKHTPGPWEAVFLFTADIPENAKVCIHAAPKSDLHNGTKVAEAEFSLGKSNYHVDSREEAEANARLIAAAPELLEALEDALSELEALASANDSDYARPCPQTMYNIRSVIAKTTGESK